MKKLIAPLICIILLIAGVIVYNIYFHQEPVVHYHAGFQVYVDDKLQDFSSYKYMQVRPCGDNHDHASDEQMEKAHLHDGVGDVVHVHRRNPLWGDLFKNIKFSLDERKGVVSFVNGKEVDDILTYPIKPFDSVVIFVGISSDIEDKLNKRVTKEKIDTVGKRSESCGADES